MPYELFALKDTAEPITIEDETGIANLDARFSSRQRGRELTPPLPEYSGQ
jgi:hypothetical protein